MTEAELWRTLHTLTEVSSSEETCSDSGFKRDTGYCGEDHLKEGKG